MVGAKLVAVGLITGLALLGSASASVAGSSFQSEAAKAPIAVRVPIRTIDTPSRTGQNGIVAIRLGDAAPIDVMLDTGSVGLRLWSVPSGAAPLGKAIMTIGGVATTMAVPFQRIDTDSSYIQQWKAIGVAGILGVGVGRGALTNPLASLPGNLGKRWSIHFARNTSTSGAGALLLGAKTPTDALMYFPLPRLHKNANGVTLWDDHAATGCWTFDRMAEQCVPTWFDSGFTVMRIKGKQFASLPQTSTNLLKPGTRVGLAAGSSAFEASHFVAGHAGSRNLARVLPKGKPTINTGNSFFFDYKVTYDIATGGLYLSQLSEKEH